MTPLRKRLISAVAAAVMIVALGANVASAYEGRSRIDCVPYDPGLPADHAPSEPWTLTD